MLACPCVNCLLLLHLRKGTADARLTEERLGLSPKRSFQPRSKLIIRDEEEKKIRLKFRLTKIQNAIESLDGLGGAISSSKSSRLLLQDVYIT